MINLLEMLLKKIKIKRLKRMKADLVSNAEIGAIEVVEVESLADEL